ncbi:MAG: hypothetical protein KC912_19740 [Proteobacteria bacterium]|nr:hypothetical protein [Pseudomonadota bacterium]
MLTSLLFSTALAHPCPVLPGLNTEVLERWESRLPEYSQALVRVQFCLAWHRSTPATAIWPALDCRLPSCERAIETALSSLHAVEAEDERLFMTAMLTRMADAYRGRFALIAFERTYPTSGWRPEAAFWHGESYLGPCGTPRFSGDGYR